MIQQLLTAKRPQNQYFCMLIALLLCVPFIGNGQSTQTFPAGSFIINMGITPQNDNNGLKPYGMIYDLLRNNSVPIAWVINPAKGKDGVDFTHNGINYRGGTFVIAAGFRSAAVNAKISSWQGQGVVGATSVAPLTLPVAQTLSAAPRWTFDSENGKYAVQFFQKAGIPNVAYGGSDNKDDWKNPAQLGVCDDIFAMPHADPQWATHGNLLNWNTALKGAIWTGCHAGSALANMFNPGNISQQTNFLSTKVTTAGPDIVLPPNTVKVGKGGAVFAQNSLVLWDNHAKVPSAPFLTNTGTTISGQVASPADPVSQYMNITDDAHTSGGSEQQYMPVRGGAWFPSTRIITWDPSFDNSKGGSPGPAVLMAYGRGFGNVNNGLVMLTGGHDINLPGGTASVAAIRAFFNFSFAAMQDKQVLPSIAGVPANLTVAPGVGVPLTISVPPPANISNFTVTWSASCGGTFSPATGPSVTFTPSAVTGSVPCNLTATVTDACGRATFNTLPIVVQCGITVATTITEPCGVSSNGSVSYTVTGGNAPFAFSWTRNGGGSGSGSGTLISGLAAGTYTIVVTAANGCLTTITRTLTTAPAIVINATLTAALCFGGSTGTINTTVSGGAPGYTYLWTGGATIANRTGLAAGTYNLTVTDIRGCTGTAAATVTQPAVLAATPTVAPANCFGEASGAITLAVTGGTAPYTYLWNNGATTQNRTGLAAGTYSVTITDARGCTLTVNSLSVTQPAAALTLTTTVVNISCSGVGTGSATVTPAGGTTPYTYNWNGTPTGDGTATITGLAAGSYPVTVTDARGCTALATATVMQQSPLTVSAAFVRPTCPPGVATLGNDGTITLTVAGGTAPRTYVWTASNGGIVPAGQSTSQNLTLLVAGTYSVTITDASSCTATTTVTLTNINPNPVAPGVIKNN